MGHGAHGGSGDSGAGVQGDGAVMVVTGEVTREQAEMSALTHPPAADCHVIWVQRLQILWQTTSPCHTPNIQWPSVAQWLDGAALWARSVGHI